MLQDVTEEHAQKTITFDGFPHDASVWPSIHPYQHAATMRHLMDMMREVGHELSVQQYMVVFLKFIASVIASVIPTIEYHFTMTAS